MSKPTKEQIDQWKASYGGVHLVTYDDGREAYLREPSRDTIGMMQAKYLKAPILAAELMMASCWLAGDESLKEDNGALIGLQELLNELVSSKAAKLKKL